MLNAEQRKSNNIDESKYNLPYNELILYTECYYYYYYFKANLAFLNEGFKVEQLLVS